MDHPMPYRILWAWDSWVCNPGSGDSYVREFSRLIDFMADWGYNGLVIWGFIDERHGGEAAAARVASYGARKGVRILPGVGAGGYEGFVISRGHRYNLTDFLEQNPRLRAFRRNRPDEPSPHSLCLYQPETLDWLRAGAQWLASSFEIGGVNVETNEAGTIDICPHAAQATEREPNRLRYAASFSDLAAAVPVISDAVTRYLPDAWITYATYEPPWWRRQEDWDILRSIPDTAIAQWNMEMECDSSVAPPVPRNVSLIHSGGWSYHLSSFPPTWTFTQYRCFYPDLVQAQRFARNQRAMKMDGFVLGNVGSDQMPDNEIAYIAHLEFSRSPEMTMDEFSARFISRLYGDRAEPLVKELMLRQTQVHRSAAPIWRAWARAMLGSESADLPAADQAAIDSLASQIDIAGRAMEVATDEGRKRLSTIVQVLNEYRTIAELSRRANRENLADLAAEAGLPNEIYHYRRPLENRQ